jgi:hypothetical protein
MKSLLSMAILALTFGSFNAQAAVWQDTQSWNLEYEQKYIEWVKSTNVREKMFNDSNSPYYGISTDCADTAYAFRAIFAFENKLPFAITNPSGNRGTSPSLNNRSNKFDSAGPENKRLVAMITEIGASVGTENLTRYDTFPIAIKSITPGSLFTYKMKARFGKFIRHAYNIKDINPIGTFDVIYSTQSNHENRGDLLRRRDREFENIPSDPWGFRKFRWPEHLGVGLNSLPQELGASNEQFVLASQMDTRTFFKYVKKQLSSQNESLGEAVARIFKNVCDESKARITYVNEALDFLKQTNNACMDYQKFDAFSTPARDGALKEMFEKFKIVSQEARLENSGDPQLLAFTNAIFNRKSSDAVTRELKAACPINYRTDVTIDLAELWKRLSNDSLSSHPNDIVEVRWGETKRPATKCKRWY